MSDQRPFSQRGLHSQHWDTWTADRPIQLVHGGTGVCLTPVLYSARANHVTVIPPGQEIRFGQRSLDGRSIRFETHHEGTVLQWCYQRIDNDRIDLQWRCSAHGEWGLRYWVNLCFSGPAGTRFHYAHDSALLTSSHDNSQIPPLIVHTDKAPLMVTFHDGLAALLNEYTEKGYFFLGSRGLDGGFAVLRFNLEEAATMQCRVRLLAPGMTIAPAHVTTSLGEIACEAPASDVPETDSTQAALQAIHDVVSWNHVYDPINERPYTVLTRFWNQQKFGGFGVWMNDVLYHGLLWSLQDTEKAWQNVQAVFAEQTEHGNFPCLVTGNDAWLDRSQPPIVAYIVWCLYRTTPCSERLRWAFPRILANHDWWWRRRRLGDTGLVAYGTSADVGDGLYKGTKLAAKNESSMDNMAVHDPAEFDASSGLLLAADVGLNSLLALDGEILAQMARELGRVNDVRHLEQRTAAHKQKIASWLWDESRAVFANRLLDGRFVESLAPTSFFPMVAGIASHAQVDKLIAHYLVPEHKFGGRFGLPSATRDDPAYQDNVYWRGRIWAPLNYWVYEGLRRSERSAESSSLAERSSALFMQGWQKRQCGENYHAETGAITDQADTDSFYTWGALLPMLCVKEVIDVTPWHGVSLMPSRVRGTMGPVSTPLGRLRISNEGRAWSVERDGKRILRGNLSVRLSHVTLNTDGFSAELPRLDQASYLRFDVGLPYVACSGDTHLAVDASGVVLPQDLEAGCLRVYFGRAPSPSPSEDASNMQP